MNNRKGFTLIELLAVIAILAILVIIALPNVMNMYNKAQKETFLTETKKIHSESEKKFISDSIRNKKTRVISSKDNTKLDMSGERLQYCVILDSKGKVTSMKVSNGKWVASLESGKKIEGLTIDDLKDGNLDNYECSSNTASAPAPMYCTFDGNMVQGAEYVNGQYTYRYMQEGVYKASGLGWQNMTTDGWGVQLTDKTSTDTVTSNVCTYINNKPVTSYAYIYAFSKTPTIDLSKLNTSNVNNMLAMFDVAMVEKIDVSNFDTSNVTSMRGMFSFTKAPILDLSNFDTGKVTDMYNMFFNSNAETINVSNFDTKNVTNMYGIFNNTKAKILDVSNFNTSKVTDMYRMFMDTQAEILNVSNFDTKNVTNMAQMFKNSKVTSLDVSNFDTSSVAYMGGMFDSCTNLKTIYASDKFVTNKVTNSDYMFTNDTKLVGGIGTTYDNSKIDKTYARIDGGTSSPGYFTKK